MSRVYVYFREAPFLLKNRNYEKEDKFFMSKINVSSARVQHWDDTKSIVKAK